MGGIQKRARRELLSSRSHCVSSYSFCAVVGTGRQAVERGKGCWNVRRHVMQLLARIEQDSRRGNGAGKELEIGAGIIFLANRC